MSYSGNPHFLRNTNVRYGPNKIQKCVKHLFILCRNYFEANITAVMFRFDF